MEKCNKNLFISKRDKKFFILLDFSKLKYI